MLQQPKHRRAPHQKVQRPYVGVGIIISKGQQVLLIRRSKSPGKGFWSPPGGHLKHGESPQQCAIREARNEAGVTITTPLFRAITNDVFEEEHKHHLTVWLEGTYVSGDPASHASLALAAVGWFPWDALPEPLMLSFEHLLTGQCDPVPWNFNEDEAL